MVGRGVTTTLSTRIWVGQKIKALIEGIILLTVAASPWAFGGVEPFEFFLYWVVGLLVVLWGIRTVIEGRLEWRRCSIPFLLGGLFMVGMIQIMPLPDSILNWLTPAGMRLQQDLTPEQKETLNNPPASVYSPDLLPQKTISRYPVGSRMMLIQILAVFLFYMTVRNNAASPETLRRLCITSVVNGCLLAFLALMQFATSDFSKLYWTIPSPSPESGTVFGPFICRNHYPFYLNLCIGLGIGLLMSIRQRRQDHYLSRWQASESAWSAGQNKPALMYQRSWLDYFQDSRFLWLLFPVTLMVASVVCSLSRGGMIALIGSLTIMVGYKLYIDRKMQTLMTVLGISFLVLLLLGWFGFNFIESRYANIFKGELFKDRLAIWEAAWPLVKDFFWTGTGYGTFYLVEPLHRPPGGQPFLIHSHAHNEYLEALIEGGWLRFGLTILLVAAVLRLAFRGIHRYQNRSSQGLILGAFMGFTAVALQSIGDFGLHIPSILMLTLVIIAQISAMANDPLEATHSDDKRSTTIETEPSNIAVLRGLFPIVGLVVGLALAGVLISGSTQLQLAFVARKQASQAIQSTRTQPDAWERAIQSLEFALKYAPDFAHLRLDLATVQMRKLQDEQRRFAERSIMHFAAQSITSGVFCSMTASPLIARYDDVFWGAVVMSVVRRSHDDLLLSKNRIPEVNDYLQHILIVRDLCPLLPQPHLRLAEHVQDMAHADKRTVYLYRAKMLRSFDPYLWYECGEQEWLDGDIEQAVRSWRRALELFDPNAYDATAFFSTIIDRARFKPPSLQELVNPHITHLSPSSLSSEEIMAKVVPDQPHLILAALQRLYPDAQSADKRKPHLERALRLLGSPKTGMDYYLQGVLLVSLGRLTEAEKSLTQATIMESSRTVWRMELAKVFMELKQYREAKVQLEMVIGQQPDFPGAKSMLEEALRILNPPLQSIKPSSDANMDPIK